jgi:hypothetical protein
VELAVMALRDKRLGAASRYADLAVEGPYPIIDRLKALSLKSRIALDRHEPEAARECLETIIRLADEAAASGGLGDNEAVRVRNMKRAAEVLVEPLLLLGGPAPAVEVESWVVGPGVDLGRLEGRVVLLYFFDIHCGACAAKMPDVARIASSHAGQPLAVCGIAVTAPGELTTPGEIARWIREQNPDFPAGIDRDPGVTRDRYGVGIVTPAVVVIDATGTVRYTGEFQVNYVAGLVDELLAEAASASDS